LREDEKNTEEEKVLLSVFFFDNRKTLKYQVASFSFLPLSNDQRRNSFEKA
jgi:hypothetical protein